MATLKLKKGPFLPPISLAQLWIELCRLESLNTKMEYCYLQEIFKLPSRVGTNKLTVVPYRKK